jgi:RNA polymerase sigma factor (sigma-70 family)
VNTANQHEEYMAVCEQPISKVNSRSEANRRPPLSEDDKDQLERLVKTYGQDLLNTCLSLCAEFGVWWGEAENLSQETWCKIARWDRSKWPPVDSKPEWWSLLGTVARRTLIDSGKGRRGQPLPEFIADSLAIPPDMVKADQAQEVEALKVALRDALNSLSDPRMQKVVLLRMNGAPWEQVAREVGMSYSWVRNAWPRALRLLRAMLERKGCLPP